MSVHAGIGGRERVLADLEEQLPLAETDFRSLAGSRVLITGGTGFVGRWLLESLLHANARLATEIRAVVLTRSPDKFRSEFPHLACDAAIELIAGDVRTPPAGIGSIDGCIHAATPASAALNRDAPLEMLDTIVDGGRAMLEFVAQSGAVPFLLTSSGAVYGAQPADLPHVSEAYMGGPDQLQARNVYAEGKRLAELQCAIYAATRGLKAKIARLFAFLGPHLPLDRHFAAGNFIRDALIGRAIVLTGDGTTIRSYQYPSETVTWLWAVYARGATMRPYNVGATEAISTAELARLAASMGIPPVPVEIRGTSEPGAPVDRYVPSCDRARDELGLSTSITVREALTRTIAFHRGA